MKSGPDKNINYSDLIGPYLRGELKEEGQIMEFEQALKEDPFLRDAVEGYRNNPDAFKSLGKLKRRTDKKLGRRNSWKSYAVWTLGASVLTLATVLVILNLRSDMVEKIAESDRQLRDSESSIKEDVTEIGEFQPDSLTSAVFSAQETDSSIQVVVAVENKQLFQDEHFVQISRSKTGPGIRISGRAAGCYNILSTRQT